MSSRQATQIGGNDNINSISVAKLYIFYLFTSKNLKKMELKTQALIAEQRINLAEVSYLDLDFVTKVIENFENPKFYDEKIKEHRAFLSETEETQQKAWRTVFHSLSDNLSSEMPRRTIVPGTSYSVQQPLSGPNLGKLRGFSMQLNEILREINNKDLSRESFANSLAGSLGLRLDEEKKQIPDLYEWHIYRHG